MSTFSTLWTDFRARYTARSEPENLRPLAELYWRSLLALASVLMLCTLTWGAWEFFSVLTNLSATPTGSGTPPATLDRKKLEGTLNAFDNRLNEFTAIKTNPPAFPDPSK